MEADWYIDPLGRFEGRFFDGSSWTHQVSDQGRLTFDPDWPPGKAGATTGASAGSGKDSAHASTAGIATGASMTKTASSGLVGSSQADPVVIPDGGVADVTSGKDLSASAVATGAAADSVVQTSSVRESPARQVAVVNPDIAAPSRAVAGSPIVPDGAPEPLVRDPLENRGRRRTWMYLGVLCLLLGLALALLPRIFSGDDQAATTGDSVEQVTETEPEVDPLDQPVDQAGDEVAVGAVTIRNGQSLLGELTTWHSDQATSRGVNLADDADCWFAKRGDVADQAAFCGPVGVDDQGRLLYDQLAVVFDDAGPQVLSASIDRASLIPNVALDPDRELVDRDGEILIAAPTITPIEPVGDPQRGQRVRGD